MGWEGFELSFSDGATRDNLFPDECLGSLDGNLLKNRVYERSNCTFFSSAFIPYVQTIKIWHLSRAQKRLL